MTEAPAGSQHVTSTYESAGVSIAAGNRAVELMKSSVDSATRPEVVGGIGGFAGLFDLTPYTHLRRPLLASSTDGVGTKVDIARRMDVHDTIGIDLVAMVLDDLVVCGAEPLFMTDYIATGKVVPEKIASIVSGIAKGCQLAGAALVGGETAEHPGLLDPDEYDIAGAGTGIVDADDVLGAERVRSGDVLVALASSGMHSNGYSLARHVFFTVAGWNVGRPVEDLGRTLGEELLEPTRIYSADCLALAQAQGPRLHALSHITGGGLAENLARVLPEQLSAVVDRSTWTPQRIFGLVGEVGDVPQAELEQSFNQGVGMVAVVDADAANDTVRLLGERGVRSWICGEVSEGSAGATLIGEYQR
ncbi:MAG TPA: phosphoribosylformylglycinamidine cyclo-ligase [Actinomycetes bacterium]|nr:phosphoribosylformylglycinamidine cyclo-ligase [Actinomycetes bacterium]